MTIPEQAAAQVQESAAPAEQAPSSSEGSLAAAPEPAPPSIADGVERSLDPRKIALDRLVGWISTATISFVNLVALVFVFLVAPLPGWVKPLVVLLWLLVTLALAWISHRWPPVEFRRSSYKLDELGIEIRKGVVWRKVMNVPRSRVQHTDVAQGPLERRYGLGTLVIYTAGTDYARVDLKGLDHATALAIRDQLLPREGGDAV